MARGIATLLAGIGMLAPVPARADFADVFYSDTCYRNAVEPEGRGDAGSFGTPLARCTATGFAQQTGTFSLQSSLVTPDEGTLPGSGYLFANAQFVTAFTLEQPVPSMTFEATVRIHSSHVERASWLGDTAPRMLARTGVHLYGYAGCEFCDMDVGVAVTDADQGPMSVDDSVLVLRGSIIPDDGPMLPAGPVYVFVFVETALVTSLPTAGTAAASFDGELVSVAAVP
ncbi:MAG: hypothetical protein ACRDJM_11110 [Actinomycetota bacterium]